MQGIVGRYGWGIRGTPTGASMEMPRKGEYDIQSWGEAGSGSEP